MRVIARKALKDFWAKYPDAEQPLKTWFRIADEADWGKPAEIKHFYRNASILQDGRVVFNIAGNKYRLVVWINYAYRVIYIRFIGTHRQSDAIDVQKI